MAGAGAGSRVDRRCIASCARSPAGAGNRVDQAPSRRHLAGADGTICIAMWHSNEGMDCKNEGMDWAFKSLVNAL